MHSIKMTLNLAIGTRAVIAARALEVLYLSVYCIDVFLECGLVSGGVLTLRTLEFVDYFACLNRKLMNNAITFHLRLKEC